MISTVVILTSFPFSKRDYDRFGVDILKHNFKVLVLDCTPWLAPTSWNNFSEIRHTFSGYQEIYSKSQLQTQIAGMSEAVVVDVIGETSKEVQYLRRELRSRNLLRAIVQVTNIPIPRQALWQKGKSIVQTTSSVSALFLKLGNKMRKIFDTQTADIAVLAGDACITERYVQIPHLIWTHSFDYDVYLKIRKQPQERNAPYIVFLDEDMCHHPDYKHHGLSAPVTEAHYFTTLYSFFDQCEQAFGRKVVIAAHPRALYDRRPQLVAGREVVVGKTAELVRDASMVFAHASTAISFAVLWRRPMVFLTTDELKTSFVSPHIQLRSKLFNAPLINMNSNFTIDVCRWFAIDNAAYAEYARMYIKRPGTPETPIWNVFTEYICENFD